MKKMGFNDQMKAKLENYRVGSKQPSYIAPEFRLSGADHFLEAT